MRLSTPVLLVLIGALAISWSGAYDDLRQLSLEELGAIQVTSVSKKPERLRQAAAAIFVLTGDDIRRSGALTIPEALRLVPGVQVAQIDSNKWAVGIRGFASRLSRSLLVMVDGRSVYTPLFAGVYWEVQDLVVDDIERIEVIRGPGGALWGANAVNGVINIITKSAASTQGGILKAALGDEMRGSATVRYGGALAKRGSARAYAKWTSMDGGFHTDTPEFDAWNRAQVGFRFDTVLENGDALAVHGDAYDGDFGEMVTIGTYAAPFSETRFGDASLSGANLVGSFSRSRGRSDSKLQAYFDRTRRDELHFDETRNTFDLDWQQKIRALPGGQELVWGAGYRNSTGVTGGEVATVLFVPPRRTEDVYSVFAEDEISWGAGLRLVLGSKFEHNDYSGFEFQPSVRFAWTSPVAEQTLWGAVSRAVRTPTRTDTDLSLTLNLVPGTPTFARILGTKDFQSEEVLSYEVGYRARPSTRFDADVTAFYDDYDRLLSLEAGAPFAETDPPPPRGVVPFFEENRIGGHGYGVEVSSRLDVLPRFRLALSYSTLVLDLEPDAGSSDTFSEAQEESAPRQQALLSSWLDLGREIELDAILRFVGTLPAQQVEQYTELDLRLSWRPRKPLTLTLIGKNLLHDHHPEFGPPAGRVEVERSVSGRVSYTW